MIYFATHWTLIIWVEIKTLQARQQAKKAPDAWSQHETTHTETTTTRKIDKFELLFILVIMTGSLILVLQKLIGGTKLFCTISTNFNTLSTAIFTRRQLAFIKSCTAYQWSHGLCDRSGIFEHPNNFWSLGWCFDEHKYSFSLVEQFRVTS